MCQPEIKPSFQIHGWHISFTPAMFLAVLDWSKEVPIVWLRLVGRKSFVTAFVIGDAITLILPQKPLYLSVCRYLRVCVTVFACLCTDVRVVLNEQHIVFICSVYLFLSGSSLSVSPIALVPSSSPDLCRSCIETNSLWEASWTRQYICRTQRK